MTDDDRLVIGGTLHITLEAVARSYDVELRFVQEVYEHGLLGTGRQVAGKLAIEAEQLDRVARIVRLHYYSGVNLPGIVLLLAGRD